MILVLQIIEDAAIHENYCRVITPEPAINEETEDVCALLKQCLDMRCRAMSDRRDLIDMIEPLETLCSVIKPAHTLCWLLQQVLRDLLRAPLLSASKTNSDFGMIWDWHDQQCDASTLQSLIGSVMPCQPQTILIRQCLVKLPAQQAHEYPLSRLVLFTVQGKVAVPACPLATAAARGPQGGCLDERARHNQPLRLDHPGGVDLRLRDAGRRLPGLEGQRPQRGGLPASWECIRLLHGHAQVRHESPAAEQPARSFT